MLAAVTTPNGLTIFVVQPEGDYKERVKGIREASKDLCTDIWAWDWEIKAMAQAKKKHIILMQPLTSPTAKGSSVDVHLTKW